MHWTNIYNLNHDHDQDTKVLGSQGYHFSFDDKGTSCSDNIQNFKFISWTGLMSRSSWSVSLSKIDWRKDVNFVISKLKAGVSVANKLLGTIDRNVSYTICPLFNQFSS